MDSFDFIGQFNSLNEEMLRLSKILGVDVLCFFIPQFYIISHFQDRFNIMHYQPMHKGGNFP